MSSPFAQKHSLFRGVAGFPDPAWFAIRVDLDSCGQNEVQESADPTDSCSQDLSREERRCIQLEGVDVACGCLGVAPVPGVVHDRHRFLEHILTGSKMQRLPVLTCPGLVKL